MTPPNAVGYANGIAQSIVSLARCGGPTLGGYVSLFRRIVIGAHLGERRYGQSASVITLQAILGPLSFAPRSVP